MINIRFSYNIMLYLSHDDFIYVGVLDYSDYGPGGDPFRKLTEKKLKEMVTS